MPVGLENYERILSTSLFREAVGHTVVFLIGYVVITLILGFFIASILNRKLLLSGFYLTLLFIPWILADILAGIVFRLLVVPDYGVLSGILANPNLFPPKGLSILTAARPSPWFGEFPFPPSPAMIYLILAAAWRGPALYHPAAPGLPADHPQRGDRKQPASTAPTVGRSPATSPSP